MLVENKTLSGGAPQNQKLELFRHPLIFQFAAICSALSASRPELKSGTQVAVSTALCVLNYIPLIFQFAAICSALSASRPELKSGTQGYRP